MVGVSIHIMIFPLNQVKAILGSAHRNNTVHCQYSLIHRCKNINKKIFELDFVYFLNNILNDTTYYNKSYPKSNMIILILNIWFFFRLSLKDTVLPKKYN